MRDMAETRPAPLTFEDEPGSAQSKWVAGALALALALWMGSGFLLPAPEGDAPEEVAGVAPVAVAIRLSRAELVTQVYSAEGQARPDRETGILAELSGEVAEVPVVKGARVARGDIIARFDAADLEAEVTRAEEEMRRASREAENAQTLLDRGTGTVDRVSAARADLATAEAELTQARKRMEAAIVRAPFDGRLNALEVDPGEYVTAGSEIARVLDREPLTVVVQVPQQALSRIEEGQQAQVRFITGEEREGVVRFLGEDADAQTRTFRAEIEVPNEGGALPSGLSAQVRIPTGETRAHFISPAILSLGPEGGLGVKTVGAQNEIVFHEIVIVRAQTDGIWISGLPDEARIVTVGQGFVSAGEVVDPRIDEEVAE